MGFGRYPNSSGGGAGTVTSVAQTVPSFLSIAGSPITTTGTLAITLATQAANLVFAGPTSGGAATPTFRALVNADFASGLTFTSAILVTPALGTPASGVLTNCTGTAAGLTAGNVTTNANLTGDVTSVGNATSIASGVIVNADINASAAIDFSKFAALTSGNVLVGNGSNVATSVAISGDISLSNAGVVAIASGVIVNADVNASAAIDFSKLASLTSAHILVGSAGNVTTDVAVTGDVTITNAGVTAIGANKVTLAQQATMATASFLGRNTAGTGNVEVLSATTSTAILNGMVGDSGSGGTKGLVPAPASGDAAAGKYLKADGTWAAPTAAAALTTTYIGYGVASALSGSANLIYDSTNHVMHVDGGNSGKVYCQMTAGTLTGTTTVTDGFVIGLDAADPTAYIRNKNADIFINPTGTNVAIYFQAGATTNSLLHQSSGWQIKSPDGNQNLKVNNTKIELGTTSLPIILLTGGTRPAASVTYRGGIWYAPGGAGVADVFSICVKDAADAYSWKVVTII